MSRFLLLLALAILVRPVHAQRTAYDSAHLAWRAGDYPDALARLDRILAADRSAPTVSRIAELTGEPFRTVAIDEDGVDPTWSGDGRLLAYERVRRDIAARGDDAPGAVNALRDERETRIVAVGDGVREIAVIPGVNVVFLSPDTVLYLALTTSAALDSVRAEAARRIRAGDGAGARALRPAIARLQAESSRLRIRTLSSAVDLELPAPAAVYDIAPAGPGEGEGEGEGRALIVGAARGDSTRTDISVIAPPAAARALTDGAGIKVDPMLAAGGRFLVYVVAANRFVVRDLSGGTPQLIAGRWPAVSADGSTLAWVSTAGDSNAVMLQRFDSGADPATWKTRWRLGGPRPSADGRTVVFPAMPREDWELFQLPAGDSTPRRLTREIQHDTLPQWVDTARILEVIGEPRHRRAHLIALASGERTRIFHNNQLRTLSMEYQWSPSPAGRHVAIVADRDGNTISPQRSLHVVDLNQPVTADEVRSRVRAMLAAERALRTAGATLFAPLAAAVRDAVAAVSVERVYQYEHDLFQFDSKHITRPGNRKAIEYLEQTLRGFGYEPELQWFDTPHPAHTANVVVRIPGTVNPDLVYVVSSHFDSVVDGPGADDNTSGTSALLEAARVLRTRPQAATIELAFFTGEEAGLRGSREYVRRAVESKKRIVGALNNDMIGYANDERLDNTIRYSNDGLRDLQHAAAIGFSDLITYDTRYYQRTDAHAYYEAYGDIVGGIGSYPVLGNPHYHQSHDVLETINFRLVAEVAKTTIASIMRMAAGPSRLAPPRIETVDGRGTTVEWDAAPERGVASYEVVWGPADEPARFRRLVRGTRAVLTGAGPGWRVAVRAVGPRGLVAWDWARAVIPAAAQ